VDDKNDIRKVCRRTNSIVKNDCRPISRRSGEEVVSCEVGCGKCSDVMI
jgi:hypothetical protein